ncbi:ribosome biogenesis factor YjgA [Orbaceae bacterium ESL0727]|nr:ribosome biogenesis factor YjgA [Orbaceae bacterium ESL0727]
MNTIEHKQANLDDDILDNQTGNQANNHQNSDDEIIYVSKSEIKRDAEALKKIGVELVNLSKNQLEKIPLDDDLLYAIELAQKIKKEGYRRQIQYIGKLLRSRDMEPITQALDKLKNRHNQQIAIFHKLELLREALITTGDAEPIIALYPMADRQQLRTLARLAKKEKDANKPAKTAKQIFQYLKELDETNE